MDLLLVVLVADRELGGTVVYIKEPEETLGAIHGGY